MLNIIISYGLTAMFYVTLASMVVLMGVLPAIDIAREIVREFRG